MRTVTNTKNREGLIELGPNEGAYGLGDTLSITPLAKALGKKAVMLMPKGMAHLAFLFNDLCPVRISEVFPLFRWRAVNAIKQKLEIFGIGNVELLPVVHIRPEVAMNARTLIRGYPNPIAFCPTCSKGWDHIRQRPFHFWTPVIKEMSQRYTVLQFGRKDYPTIDGAKRMPFVDLETLAGIYKIIGNYVGVDTGDYHLMLAVGGRCVVAEADPLPDYQAAIWCYDSPKVRYGKLSHPKTVLQAIKEMSL